MSDITSHPSIRLTRGGLILIGLMSGGDYAQAGLNRCGTVTSHGLAKCGFGDTLFKAANSMTRPELEMFLIAWRHELCHELRTNSQGHIGRKQPSLANSVPNTFPDIDVLLSYTNPITSESLGRSGEMNEKLTWAKEPDLGKLAATCEFYFEWGYREAIIKRFRTVIWHSAVLRILRRAVLDRDSKAKSQRLLPPTTPRKSAREDISTPSKMIAKHFSTLSLDNESDSDTDDAEPLIVKIHSERNHVSTDEILEYRLEIAPAQLVRIAESGIKGTRPPEGPDEWADSDDDDQSDSGKGGSKKPPPDPTSHLRVWMPACMVRIAEPRLLEEYEAVLEKKRLKKAGKGAPKEKTKAKSACLDEDGDHDELPVIKPPRKTAKPKVPKPAAAPRAPVAEEEGDDSDTDEPPASRAKPKVASRVPGSEEDVLPHPSHVVRDLTKKKVPPLKSTGSKPKIKSSTSSSAPIASSVLSNIDAYTTSSSVFRREEEEETEDEVSVPKPTINRAPKAQPVVRDLTKKPVAASSKAKKPLTNGVASSSKQVIRSDDDDDDDSDTSRHLRNMLVSPTKPNPLASWNKAPTNTYVAISDSEDDSGARSKANRAFLDDSHMFDSDDPFDTTPRLASSPTSPPRPANPRKQKSSSPTFLSSGSESPRRHLHKSPRKAPEHTSPQKRLPSSPFRNTRPTSPSPAKPAKTATMASPAPRATPLPVVEISDSDSDDDLPPVAQLSVPAPVPPLMRARARVDATKKTSAPMKTQTTKQTTLTGFTIVKPALKKHAAKPTKPVHAFHDIIDLT
ncbi:hypothetical protein DXG03_005645 [Asterophora parasitica]|uniref:Holliday junction resolvase Gen1 C-terminal domain-containing protein n=1 Tax=Asterophora parasitica TaxID=117018 RepID=A0A9P7G856_9AGAR|nr:hypothetical protein DXG03_005645 [Asterophora parasitica]